MLCPVRRAEVQSHAITESCRADNGKEPHTACGSVVFIQMAKVVAHVHVHFKFILSDLIMWLVNGGSGKRFVTLYFLLQLINLPINIP